MQVTRRLRIMCGGVLVALVVGFAASAALSGSQQAAAAKDDPDVLDLRGQRWRMGITSDLGKHPKQLRFEIRLTNAGDSVQELSFMRQDQISVEASDLRGEVVWRDGGPAAPMQISRTVASNSGIVYPIVWYTDGVPPGEYQVEARILSSDFGDVPPLTTVVTVP